MVKVLWLQIQQLLEALLELQRYSLDCYSL